MEDLINNNSPTLTFLPTHQPPPHRKFTANKIYYALHFTID